jgi:membrane-associated phospholipid phosphatase
LWVAVGCAAAFGLLTALVVAGFGPLVSVDVAVHDRLRTYALGHPTWLVGMRTLTHLGDTVPVIALYAAIAAICVARRRRDTAVFVAMTGVLVWAGSRLTRTLVGRDRPVDRLWAVDGPAFPSGHATNAAGLAIVVVLLSWPLLARPGRIALVVGAIAYALTVGFTRIAGGVHWPFDVLGGWLFAAATVTAIAAVALPARGGGPIRAQ